jgi:hypothetical protein
MFLEKVHSLYTFLTYSGAKGKEKDAEPAKKTANPEKEKDESGKKEELKGRRSRSPTKKRSRRPRR